MALYSIGILGSALIGAPLAGTLADTVGVPDTFLIIAAICASTAAATAEAWSKAPIPRTQAQPRRSSGRLRLPPSHSLKA
jgi:predicted MFS family arabinose efflux permease